jgi:hypothetical protein
MLVTRDDVVRLCVRAGHVSEDDAVRWLEGTYHPPGHVLRIDHACGDQSNPFRGGPLYLIDLESRRFAWADGTDLLVFVGRCRKCWTAFFADRTSGTWSKPTHRTW